MCVSCRIPLGYPGLPDDGGLLSQTYCPGESLLWGRGTRSRCSSGIIEGFSFCYQMWVWHESASANTLHSLPRILRLPSAPFALLGSHPLLLREASETWKLVKSVYRGGRVPLCYSPAVHGGRHPVFSVPQAETLRSRLQADFY